jgi:hypothetical protein
MKTLNELVGTFLTQSYKGYIISFNAIHNLYFVTKDGINIYSNASLNDVKINIDLLTD